MKKRALLFLCVVTLVLAGNTCARPPRAPEKAAPRAAGTQGELPKGPVAWIYDGGLKGRWQDYGWAPRDLEEGQPAQLDLSRYGGWILRNANIKDRGNAVTFRFQAPRDYGDFLELRVGDAAESEFPRVRVGAAHRITEANGWEKVTVSLAELDAVTRDFDRIVIRAWRDVPVSKVLIDDVALIGATPEVVGTPVASDDAAALPAPVTIDCASPTGPISDGIYGIAYSPRLDARDPWLWELSPSARRWGGNPTSRFNHKLGNAWNTANDWYFHNVNYTGDPTWTWRNFLEDNRKKGVTAALTVPLLGWVAKDTESYSFPVTRFGPQQSVNPNNGDMGNGKDKRGKKIKAGAATTTSVSSTAKDVGAWVEEIRALDAKSGGRAVRTWLLGNEPMLWNDTHRDVHPKAVTYDELLGKTVLYAKAVRAADPEGRIAGPGLWGWPAYSYSARDAEAGFFLKPDRRAHGDVPLLEWWLKKLHDHERETKERLLDMVDVHFYPQGDVRNDKTDPATNARRIRSVRGLWDPTYVDESWIKEPIQLIPRLRRIIEDSYPGRGIVIGEYAFGGENHMSGAIALAEALGRFGQLGVDEAYYWTYPPHRSRAFWAFRAFRNYDGKGATFGDVALPVEVKPGPSVFASKSKAGDKVVAVVVNPDELVGIEAQVLLKGCAESVATRAFVLDARSDGLRKVEATQAPNGLVAKLPPYSVSVLEVALKP
jgi:hypothetical protein